MNNLAISYLRFSSPGQADGDSLRRQTEATERYARDHDLILDKTLSFRDLGVSAYDKSNITEGALGLFLKAVKEDRIPRGAVLIVESLDRLSRAQVLDALQVFIAILNAGIVIVTLADNQRYSRESVGENFAVLMMSIVVMARAHEESMTKSIRIRASWKNKKEQAVKNQTPMTRKVPNWIHADDDRKFSLIPDRHQVALQILDMAESGIGNHTIIKTLHKNEVPAWAPTGRWEPSYIQKFLHSPALYGAIDIDGDIIDGYYPPIIDRDRFERIKALRSSRATTKNVNRKGNINIFSGLLKCGYCGSSVNVAGYKELKKGYERRYVACHGARIKSTSCEMRIWFLDELEPTVLFWLTQVDYGSMIGKKSNAAQDRDLLTSLEGQLADTRARVERTMIAIEEGATSMVPRLKQHEADVLRLTKETEKVRHRVTALDHQEVTGSSRMKGLIYLFKAMKTTTEDPGRRLLREQVQSLVGSVVDRIVLYPTGHSLKPASRWGETKDLRFIDVFFKNGATRRIEPGEC